MDVTKSHLSSGKDSGNHDDRPKRLGRHYNRQTVYFSLVVVLCPCHHLSLSLMVLAPPLPCPCPLPLPAPLSSLVIVLKPCLSFSLNLSKTHVHKKECYQQKKDQILCHFPGGRFIQHNRGSYIHWIGKILTNGDRNTLVFVSKSPSSVKIHQWCLYW